MSSQVASPPPESPIAASPPPSPTAAPPTEPTLAQALLGFKDGRPPVRTLPGVAPDLPDLPLEGADATPIREATSKAEMRAAHEQQERQAADEAAGRARGADGKFVSTKPSATPEPSADGTPHAPAPPEEAADPNDLLPAPLTLGDQTFTSRRELEQAFASHRGRAQKMNAALDERDAAQQNAQGWYEFTKEAFRRLGIEGDPSEVDLSKLSPAALRTVAAATGQPSQPSAAPAATPSEVKAAARFIDSLDAETMKEVRHFLRNHKAMGVESPEDALLTMVASLQDKFEDYITKKITENFDPRLQSIEKPLADQAHLQAQAREANAMFIQAQAHETNGEPTFPELQDPEAIDRIVKLWDMAGKSNHPRAIYYAVLEYRDEQRRLGRASSPSSPSAPATTGSHHAPGPDPDRPSLVTPSAPPTTRGTSPSRPGQSDEARRIIEGMKQARMTSLPGVEP